jgi:hypothetical protein
MSPSDKGFNQVKSILGKLDRSIDQLRQQRTAPVPAAAGVPAPVHQVVQPRPVTPPPPAAAPSRFGRATPIRPA